MKKYVCGILLLVFAFGLAFALQNANAFDKEKIMPDKKILIAYYSYSGNTKAVAQNIYNLTGGDLFEIKPETKYSADYNTVVSQAKKEKENNINPKLIDSGDVSKYDIIFLGTPVWWYTMASPVKTFLAENNFEGKIIAPFCTHGGGGASSTYDDMKKLAPKAEFKKGYTSYENSAGIEDITNWINNIK